MLIRTADLLDAHADAVEVLDLDFRSFGRRRAFGGPTTTLRVFEDNARVRRALEEPGQNRVLVVDGGGSSRTALVGDQLATLIRDNGWAGVIIHGRIRDSAVIADMDVGIRALGTQPRKSGKTGEGERDVRLRFGGVEFVPGCYVYADDDGIVVSARALTS